MVPRKAGGSPEQGSWSSLSSVCAERQCGGAGGLWAPTEMRDEEQGWNCSERWADLSSGRAMS